MKQRTRLCNNPAPVGTGANCPGNSAEAMSCNLQVCPGKWKVFQSCLRGSAYKFGGRDYGAAQKADILICY